MMKRIFVFFAVALFLRPALSSSRYRHEILRLNAVSLAYYNPVLNDEVLAFYPGWKAGAETYLYVDRKIKEKETRELVFEDYLVMFAGTTGGYWIPQRYIGQFLQSEILFRYISDPGVMAGTSIGIGILKKIYLNDRPNTLLGAFYFFPSFGIIAGYDFKRKYRKPYMFTVRACIAPVSNDHLASLEAGLVYRLR